MTERYPLRPITPDEFEAYCAVPVEAFNEGAVSAEAVEHERLVFEYDRSIAAFDGADIVGTTAAYSFHLTVPGGIANAAGVTFVGVLPTHRRRGILSAMMRHQLADTAERGEPIATLHASESGIYGRYGYGPATGYLRLAIRHGEGTLLPPVAAAAGEVRVRAAKPKDLRAELAKVYDTLAPHQPGMLARDDRWWQAMLNDLEIFRYGMSPEKCVLAEDASGPRGYALYRTKGDWGEEGLPTGTVSVRELCATDTAATAALWTNLLNRDLVEEVVARMRPVDDPLLDMLTDRRRARPRVSDGIWVRIIDLPAALTQRRYACAADVVIDVADDLLPANAGRWRLQSPGPLDSGTPTCERTTAAADIVLPVAALGGSYLGAPRLGSLAAAGLVTERRHGALARLSAAMHTDPAPWCPSMF
jgi:predicted acetyltransferase